MDYDITIPKIIPPDYSNVLSDTQPVFPEKFEQRYSAPELVAKVKRTTIKGRVDGK